MKQSSNDTGEILQIEIEVNEYKELTVLTTNNMGKLSE
jgi:hypothetical protein